MKAKSIKKNKLSQQTGLKPVSIAFVGHVDHGKSTIIGRLLSDTGVIADGKIERIKKNCADNAKPFEYAFLIDALKDEQTQGITIDSARVFFKTNKRKYIIIDAPGHIEFLKNMVTGASRADIAVLVIDANEGLQTNSFRHGYFLSMLGIKKIIVLINKMDLTGYRKSVFNSICNEYSVFLKKIGISADCFIPVSGKFGDNIFSSGKNMPWYKGKKLLDALDNINVCENDSNEDFRMWVQDVYKFTEDGDSRRIIAGTVNNGKVGVNDNIVFYPSGKKTAVKTIEKFPVKKAKSIFKNEAVGFTLKEQLYIKRGQLMCLENENRPYVSCDFLANIFWLGDNPLTAGTNYILKIGTQKVSAVITDINNKIDAVTLKETKKVKKINKNEAARVEIKTKEPIVFDTVDMIQETSRFVLVDDIQISGGGIILKELISSNKAVVDECIDRNFHWVKSAIPIEEKIEKYGQKPKLIIVTGIEKSDRKKFARNLEKKLFLSGRKVYFLGIGSVIYGVDADLKNTDKKTDRQEHIRRLSEIANILLDAGLIVIISASELSLKELDKIKTFVSDFDVIPIWFGESAKKGFEGAATLNSISKIIVKI
ncbi:MAG: GTP-binding protein [Candidatus Omnitrophica bacterium]|nr:GTP-binding protein [Candidatus Omnitrophota bacterium]